MDTKLQRGDVIEVHGWVMLAGLSAGRYRIARIADHCGKPAYSFARERGNKTICRHYCSTVDTWLRPAGDADLNRIERLELIYV